MERIENVHPAHPVLESAHPEVHFLAKTMQQTSYQQLTSYGQPSPSVETYPADQSFQSSIDQQTSYRSLPLINNLVTAADHHIHTLLLYNIQSLLMNNHKGRYHARMNKRTYM